MDAFEYDGAWWDPNEPEKEWTGTLRFDPTEGARLTVLVPTAKPEFFPTLREYDVLLGVTTTGKAVTLFRCFDRTTRGTLYRVPRRIEIFANSLIVGFHCDAVDPVISTASVCFRNLEAWWGRSAIEHDASVKWPDVSVRYAAPDPVLLHEDDRFRISIRSSPSASHARHASSLEETIRLEINAKEPAPLSDFQRIVHSCGDFFSIACLTLCRTEELSLVPKSSEDVKTGMGTFHAVPIYKKVEDRSLVPPDLLFAFADIESKARDRIGAWLAVSDRLQRCRALYFSGVYGQGFIEGKLIALSQAAEAFHRRFHPGQYMPPEEFKQKVLEPLKAAVPTDIEPSFRRSLLDRLRFANDHSLRKRMRALVQEHEEALNSTVEDAKRFVDPIVDHRNEFTHHPEDSAPVLHGRDYSERVVQFNYFLRLLLELCFLKAMGFSTDEIAVFAKRCETYQEIRRRFFQPRTPGAS